MDVHTHARALKKAWLSWGVKEGVSVSKKCIDFLRTGSVSSWIAGMLLESSTYSPYPCGGSYLSIPTAPTLGQPGISQGLPTGVWGLVIFTARGTTSSPLAHSSHVSLHQVQPRSCHFCSPKASRRKPKLFSLWA